MRDLNRRSDAFDEHGDSVSSAETCGRHAAFEVEALHLVDEGDEDSCSGAADGVSECDGSAADVDFVFGDFECFEIAEGLCSECFVKFEEVDIVEVEAGFFDDSVNSADGCGEYFPGCNAVRVVGDYFRHGGEGKFFGFFECGYCDGRSAVRDLACVSCGNGAVFVECGSEFGKGFGGGFWSNAFVVSDVVFLFCVSGGDDYIFVIEVAVFDCFGGAVVRLGGESVLFFA